MTDTETIQPALTPDEWDSLSFWEPSGSDCSDVFEIDQGTIVAGHTSRHEYYEFRRFTAIMALANAALPDDDPRKITRERVEALRIAMEYWQPRDGDGVAWDEYRAVHATLRDLHSALAALLPPA